MSDLPARLRAEIERTVSLDMLHHDVAEEIERLASQVRELRAMLFELRDLVNRRPALNAGILEAYVKWTGEVYALDWLNALDVQGGE